MDWNLGDVLDRVCETIDPATPALIHGPVTITWGELDRRSNNLARALMAAGAKPHDKIAFYMRNRAEYCQTFAACLRAHVHDWLAGYKVPKRVLAAGVELRAANGKADYAGARDFAIAELAK